ncbi:MAG: hypothetical protein ACFCUG_05130 [Thiotrichales bacterium]
MGSYPAWGGFHPPGGALAMMVNCRVTKLAIDPRWSMRGATHSAPGRSRPMHAAGEVAR